jgi:hypothetical protein
VGRHTAGDAPRSPEFDGFRTIVFDAHFRDGFILGTSTWFAPSLAMRNKAGTRKFPTNFLRLWNDADPDIPSTSKPRQSPHGISTTRERSGSDTPRAAYNVQKESFPWQHCVSGTTVMYLPAQTARSRQLCQRQEPTLSPDHTMLLHVGGERQRMCGRDASELQTLSFAHVKPSTRRIQSGVRLGRRE